MLLGLCGGIEQSLLICSEVINLTLIISFLNRLPAMSDLSPPKQATYIADISDRRNGIDVKKETKSKVHYAWLMLFMLVRSVHLT